MRRRGAAACAAAALRPALAAARRPRRPRGGLARSRASSPAGIAAWTAARITPPASPPRGGTAASSGGSSGGGSPCGGSGAARGSSGDASAGGGARCWRAGPTPDGPRAPHRPRLTRSARQRRRDPATCAASIGHAANRRRARWRLHTALRAPRALIRTRGNRARAASTSARRKPARGRAQVEITSRARTPGGRAARRARVPPPHALVSATTPTAAGLLTARLRAAPHLSGVQHRAEAGRGAGRETLRHRHDHHAAVRLLKCLKERNLTRF